MRQTTQNLLILSLLLGSVLAGCTLIAEVDRGDIPDDDGAGGASADEDE